MTAMQRLRFIGALHHNPAAPTLAPAAHRDDPGSGPGSGVSEAPVIAEISGVPERGPGSRGDFGVDLPNWGAQRYGKSTSQAGTKTLGCLEIEAAERVVRRERTNRSARFYVGSRSERGAIAPDGGSAEAARRASSIVG